MPGVIRVLVGRLSTRDLYFVVLWLRQLVEAQPARVFVAQRHGTGPLVLVGAEQGPPAAQ